MNILAIETSCDDTSISILKDEKVSSLFTYSQIKEQNKYGGVIPEIASRIHSKNIFSLIEKTFENSSIELNDIDVIAVTEGPGLVNTLQVGITVAKTLSFMLNKPLVGVNHLNGHLFSSFIGEEYTTIPKKAGILIVSGGHTIIGLKNNLDIKILGETRDDSIGEAYDKVSKILNLGGYPGGPIIDDIYFRNKDNDEFKKQLDFPKINLPDYTFSFSGLKSWVMKTKKEESYSSEQIAFMFQKAAVFQIIKKINKLVEEYKIENLLIGGGVINNEYLREEIKKIKGIRSFMPKKIYSSDNAAMIGYAFYVQNSLKRKKELFNLRNLELDSKPKLKLGE